jgi:ATP-binding cassette subfamily B protein
MPAEVKQSETLGEREYVLPTIDEGAPDLPNTAFQFCFHFVKIYSVGLGVMIVLEAIQASCTILLPYAIKQLMEGVALAQELGEPVWDHVRGPFWLFGWLNFGVLIFSRISGALTVMMGPSLRRRVRTQLFGYLQHHSQRYFLGNFAGSLANRISEVSMGVAYSIWTTMFDFWPLIITFSVSLFLLSQVNTDLTLVLAVWIGAYVTISYILALRCRLYAKAYAAARSTVSGKIVDSVTNIMNAKLFARRDYERRYLNEYLDLEVDSARRTFWYMEKIRWFQFTAAMLLMIGIIGYALKVWSEDGMSAGEFAMAASLSLLLIEQARGLSRRFLEFFEYIGNINDGVSVIIRPHEVTDHPAADDLQVRAGQISFRNLAFKYAGGISVFDELNVEIRAGEKVGLVGFSGSGKSTFVNLMLRLFEPQSGQILIDEQDIQRVSQDSLRAAISMIPQEPMLFHRTLRENIRYGQLDATDAQVIKAAEQAHAHEFILQAKDGYEALVGERGVKLSGGQRQRIALARAILKDAPILLLDEATSSLDSITERKIQDVLQVLMEEKTVVVIAHRLSTIAHLDRILVFHEGRIVEDGTHDELLVVNGHYARMWHMQAGGFLPETDKEDLLAD